MKLVMAIWIFSWTIQHPDGSLTRDENPKYFESEARCIYVLGFSAAEMLREFPGRIGSQFRWSVNEDGQGWVINLYYDDGDEQIIVCYDLDNSIKESGT